MDFTLFNFIVFCLIAIYATALFFIFLYSIAQLHLVFHYLFKKKEAVKANIDLSDSDLAFVSIQLPIYNEKYVATRLIDSIVAFDYPPDKMEIQVLDDSTDETFDILAERVQYWQAKGVDIKHVHRTDRSGYKAGALEAGMQKAKGEFIAIFDADFLPEKDFLRKTIPFFANPEIGMVQSRWTHINKGYSILTKMQAFALDGHFTVEQAGRNAGNAYINFNGTAGIWRKACIIDSGNWSFDTLTEDLDLSYRAQMKGWKFKYLEDLLSPAELPPVMSALKSQQYRWVKGGAETAKKHFWNMLKTKMPFATKFHAIFHLLNNLIFICIMLSALSSVPLIYFKQHSALLNQLINYASVFIFSYLAIGALYFLAFLKDESSIIKAIPKFLLKFPVFLAISMGLSLHNSIAALEGYFGKKTPFVRTPKFNLQKEGDAVQKSTYTLSVLNLNTCLEGLLMLYFAFGIGLSIFYNEYGLIFFQLSLCAGFGTVFYYSVLHEKFKLSS